MQYCLWPEQLPHVLAIRQEARLSRAPAAYLGQPVLQGAPDTAESSGRETGRRKSHKGQRESR